MDALSKRPMFAKLDGHKVVVVPSHEWFSWADSFIEPSDPNDANVRTRIVGLWRSDDGKVEVSTVFLGMNVGRDRPRWFETMVFADAPFEALNRSGERYETWDQAASGHAAMVDEVRKYIAAGAPDVKVDGQWIPKEKA